jgi:GNAT superfamily N-acetyltransferase
MARMGPSRFDQTRLRCRLPPAVGPVELCDLANSGCGNTATVPDPGNKRSTILAGSGYLPFRDARIPEIADLNVLPQFRRQHVGTALMDAAESVIAARSTTAGLGVGLYADYAGAHLMYLKRGYLPDGRGIACQLTPVLPGATVRLDDNLNLMMTRALTP